MLVVAIMNTPPNNGFKTFARSKLDNGVINAMTLDATSSNIFCSQNGGDNESMSETEGLNPFEYEWALHVS